MKKLLTAAMVVRSIFLPLCSDFLSVFEGEPHIIFSVDGYEIHQSAPEGGIEGVHQFSLCQGFEESLYLCPAGLLAADGFIQGFVSTLGGVEEAPINIVISKPKLKDIAQRRYIVTPDSVITE